MRMPEEKETRTESISEGIMAENFANVGRKLNIHIHKAQRTLIVNRAVLSLNSEQSTGHCLNSEQGNIKIHYILNYQKSKTKKDLRVAREKKVTYKGTLIRL